MHAWYFLLFLIVSVSLGVDIAHMATLKHHSDDQIHYISLQSTTGVGHSHQLLHVPAGVVSIQRSLPKSLIRKGYRFAVIERCLGNRREFLKVIAMRCEREKIARRCALVLEGHWACCPP